METVYVKLSQFTTVDKPQIALKDVAEVYCRDVSVQNACRALQIRKIPDQKPGRYVMSDLEVIRILEEKNPKITVASVGEKDFIIAYRPPKQARVILEWVKTAFVCLVSFFGAAFAIMTFNNDASVTEVFGECYRLVMGETASGMTGMELGYSVGLFLGITVFFNHFSVLSLNTDPTPLEVEMRLYEENIAKALIDQAGRKETQTDVT